MDNFTDLLQKIKKRPALYLGKNSIFSLQAFLDGYYYARSELKLPLTEQEAEFQEFLQWIRKRFNVETGQLWSSILLFHSADERNAIELFLTYLKTFLVLKIVIMKQIEWNQKRRDKIELRPLQF